MGRSRKSSGRILSKKIAPRGSSCSALLPAGEQAKLNVGPTARGGSGATINSTAYELQDFVQRQGASFRMVIDVGEWDHSLAMNTPGQSGDPASPHYWDLFDAWAHDESFPLLYSRERVEAAAQQRIVLTPKPKSHGIDERTRRQSQWTP
jgi:penicillin amidase